MYAKLQIIIGLLLVLTLGFAQAQYPRGLPEGGLGNRRPTGGNGSNSPTGTNNNRTNSPSTSKSGASGRGIIDDTTKQIYGPKTTRYFLEEDVFNNRKTLYELDTNHLGLHRYNYVQRANHHLTDLGNLGTATRPVFFRPVESLGTQFGFDALTPYAFAVQDVKYYNTRSPFTNMSLALGGLGQNILRFEHTQNLKPNLNLGFIAQRMTTDKFYGTSGRTDAQTNLTQNWSFVFQGNYKSKNEKYTLLGQINALNQYNYEQGGIVVNRRGSEFEIPDPAALLKNAYTWERRTQLHLYQQYVLANGFQVFHSTDIRRDKDIFWDTDLTDARNNGIYQYYYLKLPNTGQDLRFWKVDNPDRNKGLNQLYTDFELTKTNQDIRFWQVEHRAGIKGRYKDFNYRTHLRQRYVSMEGSHNNTDSTYATYSRNRFENFAGLWLNYFLKDSTQRVTAEFEYLIGTTNLSLKGELISRWVSAGYSSIISPPTLVQQLYQSNHLRWAQTLKPLNSNNVYAQANLKVKNWTFAPRIDFHLVNNYIYFDTAAIVKQYDSTFSVLRLGGTIGLKNKRWDLSSELYLSSVSRSDLLRIPTFFANLHTGYSFGFPRNTQALLAQVGVDFHYETGYYGNAYMPLTQQFYLQNVYRVQDNLLVDIFGNFRIKRVNLFLKVANATDRLADLDHVFKKGYFTTPLHTAIGRSYSFGVVWPLFD